MTGASVITFFLSDEAGSSVEARTAAKNRAGQEAMTDLVWVDEPEAERHYTACGRFWIDRVHEGVFSLTHQFGEGAYAVACQGSLWVCKAFAADIAAGNLKRLPSGNYSFNGACSVVPLAGDLYLKEAVKG